MQGSAVSCREGLKKSPTSDEQNVGLLIVTALRDYYLVLKVSLGWSIGMLET